MVNRVVFLFDPPPRFQTVRSQSLMRAFLATHTAKVRVWERQWANAERAILLDEYSAHDAEPDALEVDGALHS